jgi:NadR type nicotinamide-nucleotide adenylyltransferase
MGATHVMVDRQRAKVPCSGTMIRGNPLECLDWLTPCMRAYYIKRICLVGAESTGKTTLAQKLAEHYRTNWVPEYGREYCVKKWENGYVDTWTTEEFVAIAAEQARREDEAARTANRVLICDTDPLATGIWHEHYLHRRSPEVEAIAGLRKYDLYLLTGDEIPFEQDGLRDSEHVRHWMHERFVEALTTSKHSWIQLTGSVDDRLTRAIEQINAVAGVQQGLSRNSEY